MARKLGTGSSWAVAAAAAENGFLFVFGVFGDHPLANHPWFHDYHQQHHSDCRLKPDHLWKNSQQHELCVFGLPEIG